MTRYVERCTMCEGRKQIVGLGLIMTDCPNCDGIGFHKLDKPIEDEQTDNVAESNSDALIAPRKSGRPKLVQTIQSSS